MTRQITPEDKAQMVTRKEEHIDLALADRKRRDHVTTGLGSFEFVHCALPEQKLGEADLSTSFLGRKLTAPFLIGSMTGGPARAAEINRNLAIAAEELGIALAVGSQRVAIEADGAAGLGQELRQLCPSIPLYGNIGAVQLTGAQGADMAKRAVEMLEADGLFIHLNPLQEALQPEGDTDWRGVLAAISNVCAALDVPVIAKEIGCGISGPVARQLADAGVAAIDVAGAGGTSWAWIESQRHDDRETRRFAESFAGWGIPTADALRDVRSACPALPLIGSGGIRDGIDAAKALHLGADLIAMAGGTLSAALDSPEAVIAHFRQVIRQLSIVCFITGSADIASLRQVPVRPVK